MLDTGTAILRDFWYLALPGRRLKAGKTLARTLLGEPVLIGRGKDGAVFALRDVCPHRGIPLHHGRFDGETVSCAYHGWRFNREGRCTLIPSLTPEQTVRLDRIGVRSYPCREVQGNIWIYFADDKAAEPGLVPEVPDMGDVAPQVSLSQIFPCTMDHAAFGLMDPTHAAFIHTSWWWKRKARTLRLKEKNFEPVPLGWRMKRHRLPPENRVYRIMGREVTTEITYTLPGIRIEHVKGKRHSAVGLTALTPLSETETEVHQALYWTVPGLRPLKPLARRLAGTFLDQDRQMVIKQQEGLAHQPTLMLIDDADTQAKWFYRLKREWLRAKADGRPFENPIEPRTLRWHS